MASAEVSGDGKTSHSYERKISTAAEKYVAKELLETLRSTGDPEWEQVDLSDDECEAAVVAAVTAAAAATNELSESGSSWVDVTVSAAAAVEPVVAAAEEPKPPAPTAALGVPRGLHIAVLVCGTRGDVQPFILIGQRLQQDGHRVRLATHALFRDFVEKAGLEFWPLAGDPHKLSAHMVETGGRLLPVSAEEVKAVPEKQQMLEDIMRSTLPACVDNDVAGSGSAAAAGAGAAAPFRAQAIISNPVTYGHIHVAEYLDVPLHLMFPQPWSPTTFFPHPLSSVHHPRYYFENSAVTGSPEGGGAAKVLAYDAKLTNLLSYQMADEFIWLGTKYSVNAFRVDLQARLRAELNSEQARLAKMATLSSASDPRWASVPFFDAAQDKSSPTAFHVDLQARLRTELNSEQARLANMATLSSAPDPCWASVPFLEKIRAGENGANLLNNLRVPFAKMWSAALVPRPPDWGEHIDVIGNVFPPLPPPDSSVGGYVAPRELLEWLAETSEDGTSDPPVFIGFGSMVIKDPSRLLAVIEAAAIETDSRVLLQSSWTDLQNSGAKAEEAAPPQRLRKRNMLKNALGMSWPSSTEEKEDRKPDDADKDSKLEVKRKLVFHCGAVPHEWLFPRVSAVIHHGGAGTVAAGLRAGKPTLICPFFGDQYFWARAVHRSGVGVNLGHISRLNVAKLSAGLRSSKPSVSTKMAANAKTMAARFEAEDGALNAVRSFYRHLPLDGMVCDVSVWLPHDQETYRQQPPLASILLTLNPKSRYDAAPARLAALLDDLDDPVDNSRTISSNETNSAEVDCGGSGLKISESVYKAACRRQQIVTRDETPTPTSINSLRHGRSIDFIDLAREASVYRGACAWGNPPPGNLGAGLYQGSVGFLAESSSALKHAFVQPFSTAFEAGRDSTGNKVLDGLGGFVKGASEGLPASGRKIQSAVSTFANKSYSGARQHGPTSGRRPRERRLLDDKSSPSRDTITPEEVLAEDAAVWIAFDAAAAVCWGWRKHLGHDRPAAASEEDLVLALLVELGYEFSNTKIGFLTSAPVSATAAAAFARLRAQWAAGLDVSRQEFSAALASSAGPPPAAGFLCRLRKPGRK